MCLAQSNLNILRKTAMKFQLKSDFSGSSAGSALLQELLTFIHRASMNYIDQWNVPRYDVQTTMFVKVI